MSSGVDPVIYTFDSIHSQTLGSYDDGKGYVDIQVILSLVRDNGLEKFIDFCDKRSIKYSIEYINDNGANLRVFR